MKETARFRRMDEGKKSRKKTYQQEKKSKEAHLIFGIKGQAMSESMLRLAEGEQFIGQCLSGERQPKDSSRYISLTNERTKGLKCSLNVKKKTLDVEIPNTTR